MDVALIDIAPGTAKEALDHGLKPCLSALARKIRRKRLDCGLSQELLSHRTGLHRIYISEVERAARNISFATLLKLATGLQTNVSELTAGIVASKAPASHNRGLVPSNDGCRRKTVKVRAAAEWRRIAAVMAIETCILDS